MKKSNILTSLICAVAVSAVSVFSTLAVTNANNEVTFNSQGRIVYESPDGDSAKNVVFDASDFSTISNLVTDGKLNVANSINTYSSDAANPIISTIDESGNPRIPTFQELADTITGMTQMDNSKFKEQTASSETLEYGSSRTYEAGYYPSSWTVTGKNPSGTKTITSNGTYDVKDWSSVSVSVNSSIIVDAVNNKLSGISGATQLDSEASQQEIATTITAYWQGGAPAANISYEYHKHTTASGGTTTDSTSSSKGGCFTTSVYKIHHHSGSSSSGGGCYGGYVSGHTHSSSCYHTHTGETGSCYKKTTKTCYGSCVDNGEGYRQCTKCYALHDINQLTCDKTITVYTLTCTQSTTSPICGQSESSGYYYRTCDMTEGNRYSSEGIDYYAPACGKTSDTIVKATIIYD